MVLGQEELGKHLLDTERSSLSSLTHSLTILFFLSHSQSPLAFTETASDLLTLLTYAHNQPPNRA